MVECDVIPRQVDVAPHLEDPDVKGECGSDCCNVDALVVGGDVVLDVAVRVAHVQDEVGACQSQRGAILIFKANRQWTI